MAARSTPVPGSRSRGRPRASAMAGHRPRFGRCAPRPIAKQGAIARPPRVASIASAMRSDLSPQAAGQLHLKRKLVGGFLAAILRDARLWRAPQDEVLIRCEILDPHGEERRSRRVSNHEAEYAAGPYAIPLPASGRGGAASSRWQPDLRDKAEKEKSRP